MISQVMKNLSLSVVIPAYNEEKNIGACLTRIFSVIKKIPGVTGWEIIVVDDGSRDATGAVAKSFLAKIPHLKVVENRPNRGYGGSLKAGFAAASKDFIAFVPADNQFDFAQITRFLDCQQRTNADIVSGIRQHTRESFFRRFNRWSWNTLVRALFGYLATDIDCGFKLFKKNILDQVRLTSDGALIDTQLFAAARARGLTVAEVPVTHLLRTAGRSTGANPRVIIKALRELFLYWWQFKKEILVEKGRAVFRWEALAILAVLLIASFFRLWNIGQYLTFLGDEGRDALVMRAIVTGEHFPLIGPGTSIGNMYLGPLYYYLVAPSLAVFGFSPVGPAVQVALMGVATVALLWWIGRQWFGRIPALIAALALAVSPVVITYSRSSWNPNVMPFFALITMYGLWKVWRFGYWRWLIIAGVSFAFVLNSHYLGLLLLPPIIIFTSHAVNKYRHPKTINYLLLTITVFLVLMSPLLFFDLRHGWNNFGAIQQFFANRQTTVNAKIYKSAPHLWPLWQDLNTTLLTAKNTFWGQAVSFLVLAVIILELGFKLKLKKLSPDLLFCLAWLALGLVGLGLYKQHIYAHYYGFIFPVPFFLLGFTLQFLSSYRGLRIVSVFLLLLLFTINLLANPLRFPPNYQLSRTREISEFIISASGNQPFNLALIAKSNYDASYRYFLELKFASYFTIHDKLAEQLFVICEPAGLLPDGCNPINHPLWEIAAFGWAKIDRQWDFPWGVKLYRLVHNPQGT
ncbi:MAG: Glycosyl transferase family 39 [Candidatus Amesbacteria bacterium GW2011_GWA2_47_11]|uniref:Glycosyl transferase family 39 n=2 Tax=Candidatus Amesiibacteriota TaxID=1752730 RepID=A0A0G1UCL8_9BACT|nr:MAG: Glycosyl transferase family 39 [Candidatus Amesbacteria bacterium GW2011_GWA2_47_11]